MSVQTAVVLAAGEGTRLRPLTANRPKPMLPAGTRPILAHVLDAIAGAGIEDIHLVVGYKRDRVQSYFGDRHRQARLTYHHQRAQLGSGHALLQAREAIDGPTLVVNGDEVTDAGTVRTVIDGHADGRPMTLAAVESERAPQFGAMTLAGDTVESFAERPGEGEYRLLNAGVYVIEPAITDLAERVDPREGELGVPDLITESLESAESIGAVRATGLQAKATYPWDLLDVTESILDDGAVDGAESPTGVFRLDSATIDPSVVLLPRVAVAADAHIGPNAVVGPGVAVGRNATIEAGATVRRSVLDEDARVGSGATVIEAVCGPAATIGAGATIPGGPGDVRIDSTVHGDRRLGCVLADRAEVGGGAVVSPGVLVGAEATVQAGVSLTQNVDDGTVVVR